MAHVNSFPLSAICTVRTVRTAGAKLSAPNSTVATAGMDLALAMVEEDHGRELALRVARELVMFLKRPGGQSQFSAHLAAQTSERSGVREVQDHVLANLEDGRRLGVSLVEYRRRFAR